MINRIYASWLSLHFLKTSVCSDYKSNIHVHSEIKKKLQKRVWNDVSRHDDWDRNLGDCSSTPWSVARQWWIDLQNREYRGDGERTRHVWLYALRSSSFCFLRLLPLFSTSAFVCMLEKYGYAFFQFLLFLSTFRNPYFFNSRLTCWVANDLSDPSFFFLQKKRVKDLRTSWRGWGLRWLRWRGLVSILGISEFNENSLSVMYNSTV